MLSSSPPIWGNITSYYFSYFQRCLCLRRPVTQSCHVWFGPVTPAPLWCDGFFFELWLDMPICFTPTPHFPHLLLTPNPCQETPGARWHLSNDHLWCHHRIILRRVLVLGLANAWSEGLSVHGGAHQRTVGLDLFFQLLSQGADSCRHRRLVFLCSSFIRPLSWQGGASGLGPAPNGSHYSTWDRHAHVLAQTCTGLYCCACQDSALTFAIFRQPQQTWNNSLSFKPDL